MLRFRYKSFQEHINLFCFTLLNISSRREKYKMTGNGSVKRLRFLTYLTPDVPLDTFCLLRNCIEEASGLETDLIVEDRFTGPQQSRADPFTANNVDISKSSHLHMLSYYS